MQQLSWSKMLYRRPTVMMLLHYMHYLSTKAHIEFIGPRYFLTCIVDNS